MASVSSEIRKTPRITFRERGGERQRERERESESERAWDRERKREGGACLFIRIKDHFTPTREITRHVRALARNHPNIFGHFWI